MRGKMRGKMRFGRTVRDSKESVIRFGYPYCLPIVVISTDFETAIENLHTTRITPPKNASLLRNDPTSFYHFIGASREKYAPNGSGTFVTMASRHPTNHTPRKSHPLADPPPCVRLPRARLLGRGRLKTIPSSKHGPTDRPTPGLLRLLLLLRTTTSSTGPSSSFGRRSRTVDPRESAARDVRACVVLD